MNNASHLRLVRLAVIGLGLLLVACNGRGRTRGPRGDSSITVDSSTPDGGGDTSFPGDTSTPVDTSFPSDTSTPVDTSVPGACPIFTESSGSGLLASGNTIDETNDQSGSCGGASAPEAIIIWSPPFSGTWIIDTVGSDFDTVLYVRSGTCSGTEAACNDDASGTQSEVTVMATAGETFYIFVDGYSGSGNWVLNANAT